MADGQAQPQEATAASPPGTFLEEGGDDLAVEAVDWSSWSNLWQVPAIVLSLGLIGVGLWLSAQRHPAFDADAVLDHVGALIGADDLEAAELQLRDGIEPILTTLTPGQQARFHLLVADWLEHSLPREPVPLKHHRALAEAYAKAIEHGGLLSPAQRERWGLALVAMGALDAAEHQAAELEALGVTATSGPDARRRRARLLRRIIEARFEQEALSSGEMMARLEMYREDGTLAADDRAWAVGRQARLRLGAGDAVEAVDHLLVDMRRLERAEPALEERSWGALYTLLGRGFFDQGLYDHATHHLEEALERLPTSAAERGEAVLYLGRIEVARADPERALERFNEVAREFADTDAYLHALLARGGVQAVLGDHEAALEDYAQLADRMTTRPADDGPSARQVATALADRHDAALTMGELPLALAYVSTAESLFPTGEVPVDVLFRIASTSRQIADNLMSRAAAAVGDEPTRFDEIPPALRAEANEHYRRAGDYFVRHARAVVGEVASEDQWADSLWRAADGYDLAGQWGLAIEHFAEYLAGRSIDDPRRAEATLRLAQAHHAQFEHEPAAGYYEQVIREHPRSTFGTRAHVPLARCYLALDWQPEAEQQLRGVLEGRYAVDPDALDYRDALIELGTLFAAGGRYREAIERLTESLERYPEDRRVNEMRFRLANSYRAHALELRKELEASSRMTPADRRSLQQLGREHLEAALELFGIVCGGYGAIGQDRLNSLQSEYLRQAWFYRGDCAYELERYELAAKLYGQAARAYGDHHSSLHALVQIVNCYDRLGDTARADIAHHNAITRLRQLPDDVVNDPEALMDRTAWEEWLRHRPLGLAQTSPPPLPD